MHRASRSTLTACLLSMLPALLATHAANAETPKPVIVTNFPPAQEVSGNVSVDNFPATQTVDGTVNVGNLPATQNVSGTVNVGNLPATQNVSGTVQIGNLPAVQDVAFAAPPLLRQHFRVNLTVSGTSNDLVVPAGAVLTDFMFEPRESGNIFCILSIIEDVSGEVMFQPILPDRVPFVVRLGSGLEGPLTIRVTAGGSPSGSCTGFGFWTGYAG